MKQSLLNTEIRITSLELIDLINQFREEEGNDTLKLHKTLMRDIRDEIKVLKPMGIILSAYRDKKNENRPYYILNYNCVNYLKNNSKHDIKAFCYALDKMTNSKTNIEILPATMTRKELLVKQVLLSLFEKEQIYEQYSVLNYKIDYYIPDCRLIIEYDEKGCHSGEKSRQQDEKRMSEILNFLTEEWLNNPESDSYDVEHYIESKNKPEDYFTVIRIEEFKENEGLSKMFEYLFNDFKSYMKIYMR